MKSILLVYLFGSILISCSPSNDPTTSIEQIFELEIPECYTQINDPEQKFDFNPHTIIELELEEKCMWNLYENQMISLLSDCNKYYVGTTIWENPAWQNDSAKAFMFLNLETRILHFEDYD